MSDVLTVHGGTPLRGTIEVRPATAGKAAEPAKTAPAHDHSKHAH